MHTRMRQPPQACAVASWVRPGGVVGSENGMLCALRAQPPGNPRGSACALQTVFNQIYQAAARAPRDIVIIRMANVGPGSADGAFTGLNGAQKEAWRVARIKVGGRGAWQSLWQHHVRHV